MTQIPTAYATGYAKVRGVDQLAADNYIKHRGRVDGVVTEPRPSQSRTCGNYRIRFLT